MVFLSGNFNHDFVNYLQNLCIRNGKRLSSLFLCSQSLNGPYFIGTFLWKSYKFFHNIFIYIYLYLYMCDIVLDIYSNTLRSYIFMSCMYVQKCDKGKLTMQENNGTMYMFILMARDFKLGQNNISVPLSRTIYWSPL